MHRIAVIWVIQYHAGTYSRPIYADTLYELPIIFSRQIDSNQECLSISFELGCRFRVMQPLVLPLYNHVDRP
jgi:hypothetical protein